MTKLTMILLLGTVCLLTACSTATDSTVAPAGVSILNASCPVMGNPVEADSATTSFMGQAIGFCCAKCQPKFEAMSDEEKLAALAKNGTKLP